MHFTDDMKKALLVFIGATAMTGEKAIEMVDVLAAKGRLAVEQGKVLNYELQTEAEKAAAKEADTQATEEYSQPQDELTLAQILDRVDSLTPEELATLKSKLADPPSDQ